MAGINEIKTAGTPAGQKILMGAAWAACPLLAFSRVGVRGGRFFAVSEGVHPLTSPGDCSTTVDVTAEIRAALARMARKSVRVAGAFDSNGCGGAEVVSPGVWSPRKFSAGYGAPDQIRPIRRAIAAAGRVEPRGLVPHFEPLVFEGEASVPLLTWLLAAHTAAETARERPGWSAE